MPIVTRFAPSPNGPLHLGHAYAAVVAHDLGRGEISGAGLFHLRIDDIDDARSRAAHAQAALVDLAWLGLGWDEPLLVQSARLAAYAKAVGELHAMGLLYPCRCSRAEIARAARAMGPDGPVYPGTCRGREIDVADGPVAWRLDVAHAMAMAGPLEWQDTRAGVQRAAPERSGDVVIVPRAAPASYHLACVVDDAAMGVTLVVRGADLFAASHVHRLLQALLGLPVPLWHHHPLLLDAGGVKLAKRRGSPSLADRRRAGEDGPALAQALRAHRFPAGISLSGA